MNSPFPLPANQLLSIVCIVPDHMTPQQTFLEQLQAASQPWAHHQEMILVDNGGSLHKRALWQTWLASYPHLRILHLAAPVSEDMAYHAGLQACIGDYACLIHLGYDSPHIIAYLCQQVDRRDEAFLAKRSPANKARLIRPLPSYAYLLQRSAITALLRLQSRHRHFPTMLQLLAIPYHVALIPMEFSQDRRVAPGWLGSILWQRFDVLIHHSSTPLQVASMLSLAASGLSCLYMLYVVLVAVFKQHIVEGWLSSSLINALLFFVLFLVLAIQSEYLARILAESQGKPPYVIVWDGYSKVPSHLPPARNVIRQQRAAPPQPTSSTP